MTTALQTLRRHRQVWATKPALRQVYRGYFREIMRLCSAHRPIVEIGCGAGMLRECYPEIIATDLVATRWSDLVCSADALPFSSASIGNVVMIDVFHHMGQPHETLRELSRVLKPGGRVVMLEPWTSIAGYFFYRFIHHEQADYGIDPTRPFGGRKDAFDGNATLPRVYFAPSGDDPNQYLNRISLTLKSVVHLPAMDWLMTGGFQPYGMGRRGALPLISAVDRLVAPLRRLIALRAYIVLERVGS